MTKAKAEKCVRVEVRLSRKQHQMASELAATFGVTLQNLIKLLLSNRAIAGSSLGELPRKRPTSAR